MFIGKWNKSVILTYIGLIVSIFGIFMSFNNEIGSNIPMVCLIIAGICDLFDGSIARKCKRTEEENQFGIELDSLVDTVSFIVLPIVIFIRVEPIKLYNIIIITVFAICGIARLAYFNITTENNNKPVKYYKGLPVTFSAVILPIIYLLKYVMTFEIFNIVYAFFMGVIAILNILNIKIIKPKGIAYIIFPILAIIMVILYVGVL